jgi:small subunit ribosomal protein S16
MAVRIRLTRVGATKQPTYRLVVADGRSARDGRSIETIGHYNPRMDPIELNVDADKAKKWLAQGAQPSDTVARLLRRAGVMPQIPPRYTTPKSTPAKAPKAEKAAAPAAAAPTAAAPAAAEPAASTAAEPEVAEPATAEVAPEEPGAAEPAAAEPAPGAGGDETAPEESTAESESPAPATTKK